MILTSLLYILLAFIPVLIYIGIIYITVPWKSISLKSSITYLFTGMISIGILLTFFRVFPYWQNSITLPFSIFGLFDSLVIFSFFQIGMAEEISKLLAFIIGDKIRNQENDSPIGIMFYCGISALGFSFLENIDYAFKYGGEILIARSVISMFMHFLFGLLMGYWIAISKIPSRTDNRSYFEIFLSKRPKLRKFVYYSVGVISALTLHGLFDLSLFIQSNIATCFMIAMGGSIAAYIGVKDINNKIQKSRNNKL